MNSNDMLNSIWKVKIDYENIFDEDFLVSKDEALQPINIFFENEEGKSTEISKRSQKSQKSTSNTNKRSARKKSIRDSQLYDSNIIIVNDDEEEDRSPTDPIVKEVEKFKKLMAQSKKKKKKKNKKTSQSLTKQ